MVPTWIDNHCHLDDEPDAAAIVDEARSAGVSAMICVGVTVDRSVRCIELASTLHGVWATAGVHPHDATGGLEGLRAAIDAGLEAGVLVAVGECGLDYHYEHSPRAAQRESFAEQIGLAHKHGLPLVIHTREAWDDTFAVLDSEGVPDHTVFHCFTGGIAEAELALERQALLSISGIATFPSAVELRAAVAATPLQSLMVETDSPYLAPVPHRGKKNRPALVARVGEEVATLKSESAAVVADVTSSNARAFYGLSDSAGSP